MKPLVDDEEPGAGADTLALADGNVEAELTEEQLEQQRLDAEAQERIAEELAARLDAFGQSLAKTRSDAISARQSSGIEEEWLEDDEFYQGIDDANRGEMRNTLWRKKPAMQAEVQAEKTTRSTVFPNITGPYVDAAAARIADMLLPTDDRSWAITPTPIPDLMGASKGKFDRKMLKEAAGMFPGRPDLAKQRLADATAQALEIINEAKDKAEKAQKRIEDWHVECQWHAQVRLVIEDAARIGVGVLKGPVPLTKPTVSWNGNRLVISAKTTPGSKWVDPWNFYPHGACGENIHNGAYTWERDYLTKKQMRELKLDPDYLADQIDKCLTEGPCKAEAEYKPTPDQMNDPEMADKFEVWYYHGTAEAEDLQAAGCDCTGEEDPHLPAVVVMVNNRVIKAALNPLDTGAFPYDVMVWRKRSGHWTGIGVARQIRTPQRIVTAATRNMMDNAGIASGPMLVFRQGKVFAANRKNELAPRKVWYIAEDAEGMEDATKAIGVIKVDMMVTELMEIIQLGLKLAEDVTGLPMLLQGQQGKAPDTVGGMQMLNNNASAVLRRLARLFDDRITEPHVRRYYHYLLLYGEDDEKGDYCIDARGSSALVERDLQNQAIAQMGAIVVDPRFGLDPKKWMQEYLKSQRLDAKRFEYDDEEWQKIVENMAKGPQDPRLAIAQMREASAERQREVDMALTMLENKFEEQEKQKDRELDLILAGMNAELDKASQSSSNVIDFAEMKRKLADTVMKLRAQKDMSARDREHDARQAVKAPTEPKGRAKPGRAFQA